MSQKITSKNLSYNASLPPFLAALHAQASGAAHEGPDPILAARRRPTGKKRSGSEEAEDAPLVVDEDGNVVADLTVDKNGTVTESTPAATEKVDDAVKSGGVDEKQNENEVNKAAIGGRKRKVGKVIGDAAAAAPTTEASEKDDKHDSERPKKNDKEPDQSSNKSLKKKKAKKIKLSFDEEEG